MTILTGFDIETTGLDQDKGHRIVEVAAILYDLDTRKERLRYVKRINPERSIDKDAQAVHGISPADLVGAPKWEAIAPSVSAIFKKSAVVVAHNGDWFDFPFVAAELMRVDAEVPEVETFDTMVHGRWATPTGKSPSLKELCWSCDVEYDPEKAHAADYDVERMMECLWFGIDSGHFDVKSLLEKEAA